jgi:hypothetical protein
VATPFMQRLLSSVFEAKVDDFAEQIAYRIAEHNFTKVTVHILVKDPIHPDASALDQRHCNFLPEIVPSSGLQ